MNIYLLIILGILIGEYILEVVVEYLNVNHASNDLPKEFEGYYDAQKYQESQRYLKETTRFQIVKDSFFILFTLAFILGGGFNWIDQWARHFQFGDIVTGLIFAGGLLFGMNILSIPFSVYGTFVIEEKYGFNKTTIKTFIVDMIKGLVLGGVIGGGVFAVILWLFGALGSWAWFYVWVTMTAFQLFLTFIAPVTIMPLFNKFTPLEEGALKEAIEQYADTQKFQLQGVFTIDGSRRSTKANAFFTGFGKFRRIALFDTLIKDHTTEELVAILAHEIGHFKKKHIVKGMAISIISSGVMFYIMGLFINNRGLFDAFKMEELSIYASLLFFGFLYAPINLILSIVSNILSRKHEYEADHFAVTTYPKPDVFVEALKKLSVSTLSNLTPHPLKVFLDYSHPPVLKRIEEIRR